MGGDDALDELILPARRFLCAGCSDQVLLRQ